MSRNQGRHIGIAPGRMASAGNVVELVAKIAIRTIDPKVQDQRREPENEFGTIDKLELPGNASPLEAARAASEKSFVAI